MSIFPEYHRYDGLGLAELVRAGKITAGELVQEAIIRIERHNPRLNAVIFTLFEQALTGARGPIPEGPFRGVPFLLKDLISTYAGVPTGSGNRLLKNLPEEHDSELVRRFKSAGLIILGKTNTPEFGLVPFTEPEAFGPTCNPWDLTCSPGGSSGGSAAAVAARLTPLASGGDGGGSIRIPASCCGLFGLKPTRGRNPTGPDFGEWWRGFVVEHALTRSVRDSAALLDATAGGDVGAPYPAPPATRPFLEEVSTEPGALRIAFTATPLLGQRVHDDCLQGLQGTVELLERLGHEVVEASPSVEGEAFGVDFLTVVAAECRADMEWAAARAGRRVSRGDFELGTFTLGLLGQALTAADYAAAARRLQQAARETARFFERYDLLLTPTIARPPIPIGALQPSRLEKALAGIICALQAGALLKILKIAQTLAGKTFDYMPYTPLFNVTGQPAMSVPLHWNDAGLPIGMQFVGRFGDEATLFRLAGQLERAQPWLDREPPLLSEP